jgi:pyruvate dehydrogenase E2 component (dihydrolipoamide acetyltransferase)
MKSLEVKVPNIGVEGLVEVVELCVAAGDVLEQDSPVIVLESDKATVEVPCPCAGSVSTVDIKVGDKVQEGDLILTLLASSQKDASLDDSAQDKVLSAAKEEPVARAEPSAVIDEKQTEPSAISVNLQAVNVPDLGGSEQVEVIEILVDTGEMVEEDQTLIVLESDKATMEIPSTVAGKLQGISVKVGDKVSSGDLIAEVSASNEALSESKKVDAEYQKTEPVPQSLPTPLVKKTAGSSAQNTKPVHAGPAVRKFAREHGVELSKVQAAGPKGRILKEDLTEYIKKQVIHAQGSGGHAQGVLPKVKLPDFSNFGEVEVQAMSKIQRLTAEGMQASWLTVPHVTQFDDADITEMDIFRKEQKSLGEAKGVKLTPMAFLLKACAYALSKLPQFNVSIDMQKQSIIQKKYIHIGIAVDTPAGLVVPVIRDVDQKSLWQLAQECQILASKARDRKLSPADMQGACFTITSLGGIGGTAFTPIVNAPEVAILGVSKAQFKPIYTLAKEFEPRLMLPLSLSYDHRAVNGADAARFTTLLSKVLGDLRELLL